MIIDYFTNCNQYFPIIQGLENGMKAIGQLKEFKVGRYEFDGGFFSIQKGVTKPAKQGCFETHMQYIDLHYMVEGYEIVVWDEKSNLSIPSIYNDETDTIYYEEGSLDQYMKVTAGMCYFCFPNDGHKTCRHIDSESNFFKLVMKLKI